MLHILHTMYVHFLGASFSLFPIVSYLINIQNCYLPLCYIDYIHNTLKITVGFFVSYLINIHDLFVICHIMLHILHTHMHMYIITYRVLLCFPISLIFRILLYMLPLPSFLFTYSVYNLCLLTY